MTGRACILLVEDALPLRNVMELALAGVGYEVVSAPNGRETLRQCAGRRFDVAVLDVDLPDMSGFELMAQFRKTETGESPPVIFMTARREADLPAAVAAAGGVGLLLKPFWLCELLQAVAHCLPEHLVRPPSGSTPWPQIGLAKGAPIPDLISPAMNDDRIAFLEEKLAWLQRHVTEQDKAMLEMAGEFERLKKQVAELRGKLTAEADGPPGTTERPPHY